MDGDEPRTAASREGRDSASPHSSRHRVQRASQASQWMDSPCATSNCESFTTARCFHSQHNLWQGIWPDEVDVALNSPAASVLMSVPSQAGRHAIAAASSSCSTHTPLAACSLGGPLCADPDMEAMAMTRQEAAQQPHDEDNDFGLLELASRCSWDQTDSMLSAESSFNDPDTYGRMISDVESDKEQEPCTQPQLPRHGLPAGVLMQAVPCVTVP